MARKRKTTAKQKAGLAKGQQIMKAAIAIQRKGGTKTVPAKKVFKVNMKDALKQAARTMKKKSTYR